MANPLYESLTMNMYNTQNTTQMDPLSIARQAGYNIPDGMADDSRTIVMHLLQSGQVSQPMLQKIGPLLGQLAWR